MSRHPGLVLALLALAGQGEVESVRVGEPVTLELDAATTFRVAPSDSAKLTVTAESADGDVWLRRVDESGTTLTEDDDGGIEWNARLVVDVMAGEPVLVRTGFKDGASGELTLSVLAEEVPLPEGPELVRATARFLRQRARSERGRGMRPKAILSWSRAGQLSLDLGDLALSRRDFATVLELAEQEGNEYFQALALLYLGSVDLAFEELELALDELLEARDRATALRSTMGNEALRLEMFARRSLASAQSDSGDPDSAIDEFMKALDAARTLEDESTEARLCAQLGEAESTRQQVEKARAWFVRALDLARRGTDTGAIAEVSLLAGRFHEREAEFESARELLEESREHARSPRAQAQALGHLGTVALATGDTLTAVELYDRVLVLARSLGDRGLETDALTAMGNAYRGLGDLARASACLRSALDGSSTDAFADRAELLRALARVEIESGEMDEADRHLTEALELARSLHDRRMEALVLHTRVWWYHARAEYEEAFRAARLEMALADELGVSRLRAAALDSLAELHLRTGERDRAREYAEAAIRIWRALDAREQVQGTLLQLAAVAAAEGDAAELERIVREAESCFAALDVSRFDLQELSLLRATDVYALWSEYSQDLAALSSPTSLDARTAGFRRSGLWKGYTLLLGIAENRRGGRDPLTLSLRRERREVLAERDELLVRVAEGLRGDSSNRELDRMRDRARELDARARGIAQRLRDERPEAASLDVPSGVTPEMLIGAVGDDVLVEFTSGRRRLYAYVLADGRLSFHDLGDRSSLESEVVSFVEGIGDPASLASVEETSRRGKRLHGALLGPLLAGVDPARRLIVVPTAALAALPFEALVTSAPDSPKSFAEVTFLIDERQIVYVPSTPVLRILADTGPRAGSGTTLVIADPLYEITVGESGWPRLPGTRVEALAIASTQVRNAAASELEPLLASRRSVDWERGGLSLHVGASATPALLRGDLRRFGIVHFASHARVGEGIVLSPDARGEYVLSLRDVLDLDLDADLAVLSACETGRGEVLRGEGVQSLARAFLHAGARSVIASLWQVDDHETQKIMRAFYAAYPQETPASALRRARLAVRNGRPEPGSFRGLGRGIAPGQSISARPGLELAGHPFFWAPFVLIGPPR